VIVTPSAAGDREIELLGDIAAMIRLASNAERTAADAAAPMDLDLFVRLVKVVARACSHLYRTRFSALSRRAQGFKSAKRCHGYIS